MRLFTATTLALYLFTASQLKADALLLRNGNSIEGNIQRTRDAYVVRTAKGGTIHVPNTKVQIHVKSLDDIYRWKLRRTKASDVKGQVKLANWCVQEGLSHHAVDRLLHLSQIAPLESSVQALERQMLDRVRGKSNVIQATAVSPVKTTKTSTLPVELKEDSVLEFRRVIQPLLINRCGQASCHGSTTGSDFRLVQFGNLRPNRQLTMKNLETVTRLLSTNDPTESPLLLKAQQIHGNQKRMSFEARDIKQYRRLERWAFRILDYEDQPVVAEPPNGWPGQTTQLGRVPTSGMPTNLPPQPNVVSNRSDVGRAVSEAERVEQYDSDFGIVATPTGSQDSGVPESDAAGLPDPFDPQAFNNTFHAGQRE